MHRIIIVATLIIALSGCQTLADLPEEQRQVVAVHEVPGKTKDEIYVRALEWFATTFRDSKAVLEVKEKESGLIVGKGIIPGGTTSVIGIPADLRLTIKIEIKDGKFRATYDGFTFMCGPPVNEREVTPGIEHDAAKKSAATLDAKLAEAVGSAKKDF